MLRMHGVLAGGVIAGVVAAAHADSVYVDFGSSAGNTGRSVWVSLSGGLTFWDGATDKQVWAGQTSMLVDGLATRSYSAQLTSRNSDGWFDQVSAETALGSHKSEAVAALFGSRSLGELQNREEVVAFQAMLWEIVYDYDGTEQSIDLTSGRVAIAGVNAGQFASMKTGAMRGGDRVGVTVLSGEGGSDSFRIVPLPSAAGLAGVGCLGLAVVRRRR